jgi:hypothetical protein
LGVVGGLALTHVVLGGGGKILYINNSIIYSYN